MMVIEGSLKRDTVLGVQTITFKTHDIQEADSAVASCMGKQMEVTIKPHREKRSLSANAYYWVLVTKIAAAVRSSTTEIHNRTLGRYGTLELIGGEPVEVALKSGIAYERLEDIHLKPLGSVREEDGVEYAEYYVLKPSHEMDTAEMSALIDGAVSEAKDLGIETLPPDELERMVSAWKVG